MCRFYIFQTRSEDERLGTGSRFCIKSELDNIEFILIILIAGHRCGDMRGGGREQSPHLSHSQSPLMSKLSTQAQVCFDVTGGRLTDPASCLVSELHFRPFHVNFPSRHGVDDCLLSGPLEDYLCFDVCCSSKENGQSNAVVSID